MATALEKEMSLDQISGVALEYLQVQLKDKDFSAGFADNDLTLPQLLAIMTLTFTTTADSFDKTQPHAWSTISTQITNSLPEGMMRRLTNQYLATLSEGNQPSDNLPTLSLSELIKSHSEKKGLTERDDLPLTGDGHSIFLLKGLDGLHHIHFDIQRDSMTEKPLSNLMDKLRQLKLPVQQ